MVALVVAAKFNDDERVSNTDFARIGGMAVEELAALELELLRAVQFSLRVAPEVYVSYLKQILAVNECV